MVYGLIIITVLSFLLCRWLRARTPKASVIPIIYKYIVIVRVRNKWMLQMVAGEVKPDDFLFRIIGTDGSEVSTRLLLDGPVMDNLQVRLYRVTDAQIIYHNGILVRFTTEKDHGL